MEKIEKSETVKQPLNYDDSLYNCQSSVIIMWSLNLWLIPAILPEVEKWKKSFYKKSVLKSFPNFNENIRNGLLILVK